MVNVFVPDKGTLPYTLFADGKIISGPVHIPEEKGTHISFEGVVILYYVFHQPHSRRKYRKAYVVSEKGFGNKIDLECVEKPVYILFEAKGRKIDLLKRIPYYIGTRKEIYLFDEIFWTKLTNMIDFKFNGRESALSNESFERHVRYYNLRAEIDKKFPKKVEPPKLMGNPAIDEITMMYWKQENEIKG